MLDGSMVVVVVVVAFMQLKDGNLSPVGSKWHLAS